MNLNYPRAQLISCIGLKMVSKYVEVFLGKNHSKCLSYTVECHIYIGLHFMVASQAEQIFCSATSIASIA